MNLLCRWKYRNIASPDGPVAEIDWTEIDLFGSPMYEVHVKLKDSLVKARDYKIHSNRDGFGTDQARDVALFKAFSESMEHWCFDQTVHSGKYGFNIDQTTNGMAFHPRKKLAETISEFEAVERWSVKNWWFGKAEHKLVNISDDIFGIEIISPFVGIRTAVIWKKSQSGTAYGFASHVSLDKAIQKAKIELHRNLRVLALGATIRVELLQERRILFFASQSMLFSNTFALPHCSVYVSMNVPFLCCLGTL